MFLSASPIRQTGVPASVTQPSNLSVLVVVVRAQPLASSLLGFPELQERHGVCGNHDSVIHGFTPVGRANHYMPSLEFVGITVLFLDEKVNSVIHGFTPVGRANHYMPSLKAGSIVKVDRFEVSRCSSMYKITDHPFLIRFISLTIIDEVITGAPEINLQSRLDYVVGKIHSVQGSGLTKETSRVVIRLLIDP
ncbi:hypothetical protein DY000_02034618 [Brassica cretica]|uniref:DUF223 domain-containing protein n=1 Tax=Brassica cretica TaxID=69181 RepID=A0ABQ7DY36_BRACR|nr:hypothetical protein DY000_02034618 [Brassica cretica]